MQDFKQNSLQFVGMRRIFLQSPMQALKLLNVSLYLSIQPYGPLKSYGMENVLDFKIHLSNTSSILSFSLQRVLYRILALFS